MTIIYINIELIFNVELQIQQTVILTHYSIGLFTTTPAKIENTVNTLNLTKSASSQVGGLNVTYYSNEHFSFYFIPNTNSISFQILGKIEVAELMDSIAEVLATLGLIYTPGNTLGVEFDTVCDITSEEFEHFQTIFAGINKQPYASKFSGDEITYTALKFRVTGKTARSDVTFSLLSNSSAQFTFVSHFNNEPEFSKFINDFDNKFMEEIINAIIKI